MDIVTFILLVIVGLFAGIFGGLIGTGGCSIMLPILDLYLQYSTPIAIGTTLFAVMFTTGSGAYGHLKIRNLDVESAKYLAAGGIVGVIIGSIIFEFIKSKIFLLQLILGFVFILPSVRMIYEGIKMKRRKPAKVEGKRSYIGGEIPGDNWQKILLGLVIGITTGLVGLGGGYALVPALIYLFGGPVHVVMGTSLAVMVPMTIIGSIFKVYGNSVDIIAGITLGIGTAIGAQIGARLIKRFDPHSLKIIFGLYFLYISLKYINLFLTATTGCPRILP